MTSRWNCRIAFLFFLATCCLTPLAAQQQPGDGTTVQPVEGSNDIIERELWFTRQRVAEGEEAPGRIRMEAWGQLRAMNVYRPNVLDKTGKRTTASWVNLGPRNRGGRVTGIAIHPTNPDIIYLTAANGGIWKSVDGGTTLVPIADDLPTLSMGAIAIDPSNPDNVWAGSGEANVWTYSYPGLGVFKSTDAGASWSPTAWFASTRTSVIRVHPADGNTVLAATLKGLMRTTDAGGSWQSVLAGEVYDLMMHPDDAATWYAAVRSKGIYRSTDTGDTWEYLSQSWVDALGLDLNQVGRLAFDCCKAHPEVMYATLVKVSGNNLYRMLKTTDGGATWDSIPAPPYNVFNGQGFYNCDLAVDPVDPDRALLGGILIYQTLDGGRTWTYRSPSHADQHALEFAPSDPRIFYTGHDGGFNRSTDGGSTFDGKTHIMPITQYYDIDVAYTNPDIILGGTQDNGSHLRSTPSEDWLKVTGSDGAVCNIDYENPGILYTEMQNGQNHWRSIDSGKTWVSVKSGIQETGPWITPVVMHPRDPATLLTATTIHLYKTTNRGDEWIPMADPNPANRAIQKIAISPADPSHMAVGYRNTGGIATTTDGGATWTLAANVFTSTVTDIEYHAADPDRIYVTFSGYSGKNIVMTTDGGGAWEILNGNLPATPVNTIALDPSNDSVLWIGTDLKVFVTSNMGRTWDVLGDGMPIVSVQELVYHAPSGRLFAATHGRGIYELAAATPVESSGTPPDAMQLDQSYPNPGTTLTTIRYTLPMSGDVRLTITDAQGKRVALLAERFETAGTHTVQFDVSTLPKGVYFCQLSMQGETLTRKMVVLR
ncbi:MAG: T9SS type A sorting domain-containing protein [Bacteroidetes bacterium]|nr:T9SS type A sorting domain-containing protein [Bacteroidota bacterium]